jgi:hypothetical protein
MTANERIACALGDARRCGRWWRCRCPVHGSRGATLALRTGNPSPIGHCHAGGDPREIFTELRSMPRLNDDRRAPRARFRKH